MSLFPRLLLAFFAALFGAVMFAVAPPDGKAIFFYAFGALCLAIAMACVTRGRIAQFSGSVVGLGVFASAVWYSATTLLCGQLVSGSRSQPSFVNSLFFFVVFGLPGAAYAWSARFGFGKRQGKQADSEQIRDGHAEP